MGVSENGVPWGTPKFDAWSQKIAIKTAMGIPIFRHTPIYKLTMTLAPT